MLKVTLFTVLAAILLYPGQLRAQNAKSPHASGPPVYRDYQPYPIDSRKPCNICARPADRKAIPHVDLPGLRGRPHLDQEPGGCRCGKKHVDHHPMSAWSWPMPFSAKRQQNHPNLAAWLEDPCRQRLTGAFDKLTDFKLIPYQRTDNGYCGPGRDPYGCLGESRQLQTGVAGLNFRQPGEPAFGSPPTSREAARYNLYPTPVKPSPGARGQTYRSR